MNTQVSEAIKMTPYEAVFGQLPPATLVPDGHSTTLQESDVEDIVEEETFEKATKDPPPPDSPIEDTTADSETRRPLNAHDIAESVYICIHYGHPYIHMNVPTLFLAYMYMHICR